MCANMGLIAYQSRMWITLVLLLQFICSGVAIKCYVCDSSDNPSCENLKSNSSIVAEECSLDKMKSINSWLFDLNKFAYFDMGPNKSPLMNCQKVVAQNPINNKWVTARFCQLDTGTTDACNILRTRLKIPLDDGRGENGGNRVGNSDGRKLSGDKDEPQFFCDICNIDRCNGCTLLNINMSIIFVMFMLRYILQY